MEQSPLHFLKEKTIKDICKPQTLVWVPPETTLEETLQLLHDHDFLSVPVFDKETNKFIGIVSVFDIMIYLSRHYKTQKMDEIDFQRSINAKAPVAKLVGLSPESSYVWLVHSFHPLENLFETLSMGVHRALVEIENGNEPSKYQIITQSDIIQYLKDTINQLGSIVHRTADDLGLVQGRIISAKLKDVTLQVLRKMTQKDVNAVGVVDNEALVYSLRFLTKQKNF
eukprot:TRINITY_DN1785_c0_g1_i3.p1 TRINITY_DN1785_c0_g1~~TRINITY_DN1785_c0_g1_i3.p1  ORF type:complete len:226 (-),score=27.69 TRINITY_DN1785_c0_g1_i3:435-1112(-)